MNFKFWNKKSTPVFPSELGNGTSFLSGLLGLNKRNRDVSETTLLRRNLGYVAACINSISNKVIEAELKLYVKGGSTRVPTKSLPKYKAMDDIEEVLEHPVLVFMAKLHNGLTWKEIVAISVKQLELLGNAYWRIEKSALGIPETLTILQPDLVELVVDSYGVTGYRYKLKEQVVYPKDEIIHIKHTDVANPYGKGIGRLEQCIDAADLTDAGNAYMLAFFDNMAVPSLIIEMEGASQVEIERASQSWKNKYAGIGNAFKTAFLGGGKAQVIGGKPIESGVLEALDAAKKQICAVFGVPVQLLDISQSRAELEAASINYLENTIEPRLRQLESTLNYKLLAYYGNDPGKLFFKYDCVVPENDSEDAKIQVMLVDAGIITRNEARQELDMEVMDDPEADVLSSKPKPIEPADLQSAGKMNSDLIHPPAPKEVI